MKLSKDELLNSILTLASLNLLLVLAMAFALIGCGTDSGSGSAETAEEPEVTAKASEEPSLQSIMLDSAADLPECSDANDKQLAYAKAEDTFYTCKAGSWDEVTIKGRDGRDGVDGVTTVNEVEATNKKNQWVDSLTGKTWLIGGGGTYAQAAAACTGDYRLPTWAEAELAISHGIRAIAASIPATQNFWIDTGTPAAPWYATETSGLPNKFQVAATSGYAVYCVK